MLEYEIPFVCLIFTILISIVFFAKKKIELEENFYYKNVLIFTLMVNITNFISHYGASLYLVNTVDSWYTPFFAAINKLGSLFIVIITFNVMSYIFYISFDKYKKNFNLYKYVNNIIFLVVGILIFLLDFNVTKVGAITGGNGPAVTLTFGIVFFNLIITFVVSLLNIKKYDRRYNSIYIIIPLIFFLGIFVMFHPEFNIYDLILCLLCYLMYFTIENPDLKMIEQLNLAKDHAEKANRAKSDFLSSMSHEIRTPLNAIVGFSQCILEEDNLDNAKEDAKDIVTASQNLLEIVNGILDISKIEADKMEIVEVNYNPRDNFEKLAKLMIPRIGEKPIELKTKIASDLPATLYGDVSKVKQIVTNILTNAVKYTEKGEINFEVNCVNNDDESKLIISIEVTGRGIKPEKIDKLFNKFERLDEDRNTTTEGTGLGLAITKRLVEMMGGKIVVQSKYGEGSKFTVYLKQKIISLNQEIVDTKIGNVSIDEYPDKKVLVVDDNKINIKVAERLLKDYKVKVESVESGYACLDLIKTGNHYDLILLDDMMPQMSGVETLKELKAIDGYNIPTVALTANAISGMREKYLNDGFDDYLSKPMDKGELHRVLSIYLSSDSRSNLFEPLPPEIYEIEDNNQVLQVEDGEVALDNKGLYQNKMDSSTQSSSVCVEHNQPSENRFYHNIDYLKQNGIDVDKGLELLDDIELYNETFENFIIETDHRLKELTDYHNQNDMANYAILAHATKSDAKYLGCDVLAEIAYNHEMESKNDNIRYINEHFYDLLSEVKRVVNIGKKYLGKD